jgi:DNA relaxase NicK
VLTVDAAGGEKLTIGSRVSPRYGRIYLKDDPPRVRHELELKQDVAGQAWDLYRAGFDLGAIFAAEYGRLVEWR